MRPVQNDGRVFMKTLRSSAVLLIVGAAIGVLAVSAWSASTTTTIAGKGVTQVKVVRSTQPNTIARNANTPAAWFDLPGATTTITVPASTSAHILARFSAEATAGGDGPNGSVRILINGVEAKPDAGMEAVFTSSSTPAYQSLDRSAGPFAAGTYTIQVQYAIPRSQCLDTPTCSTFTLNDWSLTVERVTR
jgi:hypothetical protein